MITENLSTLKINRLTKEQYEREKTAGTLDSTALYLTPAVEVVPESSTSDAGKILMVGSDGNPAWTAIINAEEVAY